MSTASLPLPVGARAAGPAGRSVAQAWAAPRAADLVLDVWAAPVGPPIAPMLLSPWPAPNPSMRIVAMAAPAALTATAELTTQRAALAESTEAALAAIAASQRTTAAPAAAPAPADVAAPSPNPAADAGEPSGSTSGSVARLRARMWAMVAGGALAAAGAVTLIATAF